MSNRVSVLAALIQHGESTMDELHEVTGIDKSVLRYSINDAKKAGHIEQGKDIVTQLPAYTITGLGRTWYETKKGAAESETAAPEKPTTSFNVALSADTKAAQEELAKLEKQLDEAATTLASQVDTIVAWKKAASSLGIETPEMLVKVFNEQDIRLTDQIRKTNEALQQVADLEAAQPVTATVKAIQPAGFVVAIPKKPLRRFTKLETVQALALGAVRAGSQAEVFALHPVGKAVRGAEWKPA